MEINLDEEIERMNEEIIELREDNQRLHNMCVIMEQISDILTPIVNECKCHTIMNSKIKTKLNILTHKYKQLKDKHCDKIAQNMNVNIKEEKNDSDAKQSNSCLNFTKTTKCVGNSKQSVSNELNKRNILQNRVISSQSRQKLIKTAMKKINSFNESVANAKNYSNYKTKKSYKTNIKKYKRNKKIPHESNGNDDNILAIKTNDNQHLKVECESDIVERKFRCDWPGCDKMFKNQSNLNGHRDIHLEVKRYRCDWPGCEEMFLRKGQFEAHMSCHTNDKRFKCDWPGCGYQSCRTDKLKIHKRVHTGEKPYVCDWPGCEFASSYEKGLQRHKMRHTGEKPYRCEWPSCNWSFRQLTHLKAHLLKHTGEKPFECEYKGCDRKFSSRQAMRFHFEKSHTTY